MGSRLRPVPDRVLECLIEVSAPSSGQGAKLLSYYPETYEDEAMLRDVVPEFCFPFDKDTEMVNAVQHFTFVLTSIDSLYRFGFCRYPPKAKTCLCILSDLPAFDMFYGMLNTLAELENTKNETLSVKQFMDLVLESQVPEPGCKFTVSIPEKDWTKQYNYPDPTRLPSIPQNRNLTDYFSAVNPSNMIALFASMLFERRIIITSKKLSLLTACTYSASSLLYPMYWQHVFIPAIPPSLVEYCCAPMPFLVGVHSSLMDRVRDMPLDDVVILDVDKDEIELPFDDLDDIPSEAVHRLDSALKKTTIAIGDYVSQQFLSAIVSLIGGYRDALKVSSDTIIFEKDMFVNSRPHIKPFLENLLKLQLFEQFIHHRLEQLNAGESTDDVFEEQVGLQAGNNIKWASQYKQWVKNRKRDGSQLFKDISGKTEKARYKANKFMQASLLNMKNHSKSGWKEAIKGIKSKKKNMDYTKGAESELDNDEGNWTGGGLQKCNSLPMRKVNGLNNPPLPTRKSIGSSLHNQILFDTPPAIIKKSPCPSRPPPRHARPPRTPPRPPSPYKPLSMSSSSSDSESPKLRPSMCRDPNEPPVKDLIVFYDSQVIREIALSNVYFPATKFEPYLVATNWSEEDLVEPGPNNPFENFKEYDGNSGPQQKNNEKQNDGNYDKPNECEQDLLWETMVSLSDDTRQFLRQSRIESYSIPEIALPENGKVESGFERKEPLKKTLKALALDHRIENKSGMTHAGSWPQLLDPSTSGKSSDSSLRSSSTNIAKPYTNGVDSNGNVNAQCEQTHCHDPFVQLITQRHNLKTSGLPNPKWVKDFE